MLHAGAEHRALRVSRNSQLKVKYDSAANLKYLEYSEYMCKMNQGGLDHRKVNCNIVRAYENKVNGDCCFVKLFEFYLSVCPVDEKCPQDFYLQLLVAPMQNVWYTC